LATRRFRRSHHGAVTRLPWRACQRNWPIRLSPPLALSGKIGGMTSHPNLDQLNPEELRALAA